MALAEELKVLQANVVAMYAQAHGYHWNVEGMLFKELHAFFLEIYEDVYDQIDTISENLRKLGTDAPFGMLRWAADATIETDNSPNISAVAMVANLAETNAQMVNQLKAIFKTADAEDEQGIANYIAERIDKHQFWNWQLISTLKKTVA